MKKKINILHIISAPAYAGAEIYVKDLCLNLKKSGYNPHIGFVSSAKSVGFPLIDELRFIDELNRCGIKSFVIGHLSRKFILLGAIKVYKYCNFNKIDLYHSHLLTGIFFSIFLKIPKIYTQHNIVISAKPILFKIFFNRFIDSYIGISALCTKALESYCRRKVNYINNCVDFDRLVKHRTPRNFDNQILNFLCVARVCKQKNYMMLVDAIKSLPDNIRKFITVSIIGNDQSDYANQVRSYINSNSQDDIFNFYGTREDVPQLMANHHVFLLTSDWEGLPIALLESVVMGLPCIVTNVGGCSEVINSCQNGFLIEPNDHVDFAKKIEYLFSNRQVLSEFSNNAIRNSYLYSIDHSLRSHVEIYRSLLP